MTTSNKQQLDRYIKQSITGMDNAERNIQKMLDKYEGRAQQQYDDLMIALAVIVETREYLIDFYKNRM